MSPKFNRPGTRARATSPVTTTGPATTYEGGPAFTRDARSELVLLAVVNMVGEDTFYESAADRDDRFASLCRRAAVDDGLWYLSFVRWLRGEANMRSAALVAAAVGVRARLDSDHTAPVSETGVNRRIVDAVLQRPDEPGEFLAFWHATYGRTVPMPVKRGLGDAARRLYNERSLLKYDTESHAVRFGDVLELAHPSADPDKPWQGDLFTYALHRRHGYTDQVPETLTTVKANRALRMVADANPRRLLDAEALRAAGMTWEDALSLAGSKVAKAKLWDAMIPSMGYMALLRNLRNFDEAGISDAVVDDVISRLTDPAEVAKSRQFPYRFLSAYRATASLNWGRALETALNLSTANVPAFTGRTLVLIDTSASMRDTVSAKSDVRHVDIAALTGAVFAARSTGGVDLVGFANESFTVPVQAGSSALRLAAEMTGNLGRVGHGTNTVGALRQHYAGHDRVVIVHDGQFGSFHDGWPTVSAAVPAEVPVFGIDTSGYSASALDTSRPNRYEVGGFSDKLFTMIALLDSGRSARWPWEE
jgi:hypothetical protein